MEEKPVLSYKLIHVATIFLYKKGSCMLYLRQKGPLHFAWFIEINGREEETDEVASTIEEALRLGRQRWKNDYFCTLNCGFRYTLPERDEHGINALFHQMVSSYSASNGVYFDDELGHNCFVQAASLQALDLWSKLRRLD